MAILYTAKRFEKKLVISLRDSSDAQLSNSTADEDIKKTCFPLGSLWEVLYRRRTRRHSARKRWRSRWAQWVFWGANRDSKMRSSLRCPYTRGSQLASGSTLRFLRFALSIQYPNRLRTARRSDDQTARRPRWKKKNEVKKWKQSLQATACVPKGHECSQRVTYSGRNLCYSSTYAAIRLFLILNTVMQERTGSSEKKEADGTECDISRVAHETFLRLQNSIATCRLSHIFSHSASFISSWKLIIVAHSSTNIFFSPSISYRIREI